MKEERISRGEFLRRTAKVGAIGAGIMLHGNGLRVPEVGYMFDASPKVNLIVGDHRVGEVSSRLIEDYQVTGDLKLTIWNEASEKAIDASMREARKRNKKFSFCIVDGVHPGQLIPGKSTDYWYRLPHPDLLHPERYPQMTIVGAEEEINFGLSSDKLPSSDHAAQRQMEELIAEMNTWYDDRDGERNKTQALRFSALEGGIATGLIAAGLYKKEVTRRRGLALAGSLVGGAGLIGFKSAAREERLYNIAGNRSSGEQQRIITGVGNMVESVAPNTLFKDARTAWAIEKGLELAKIVHQPINMLYGYSHGENASQMQTDPGYRRGVVKSFITDLVSRIDTVMQEDYKALLPYRKAILTTAALSTTRYSLSLLNIPWGKVTLTGEDQAKFEKELVSHYSLHDCPALVTVAKEVLSTFS